MRDEEPKRGETHKEKGETFRTKVSGGESEGLRSGDGPGKTQHREEGDEDDGKLPHVSLLVCFQTCCSQLCC